MNRESERKRLVELVDNSFKEELGTNLNKDILDKFAQNLLDNGIVVPPCKVGAEVFYVHEICDENGDECLDISKGEVVSFSLQKEGLWVYCRYEDGLTYWHLIEEFGIELFLTREQAEQALKEGVLK